MLRRASQISFVAASSPGKWPRVLMILSSNPFKRRSCLPMNCGSNEPSRSLATSMHRAPWSVSTVLALLPWGRFGGEVHQGLFDPEQTVQALQRLSSSRDRTAPSGALPLSSLGSLYQFHYPCCCIIQGYLAFKAGVGIHSCARGIPEFFSCVSINNSLAFPCAA